MQQLDFFDILFDDPIGYPVDQGYLSFPLMEMTKESERLLLEMLTNGKIPVWVDHDGRNMLTTN